MKVKEYREMMKYLTRPGTPDQGQKDMETQVKKSVENNKNPGTFKKLVKEDEAAYRKKTQGYLPGMEPELILILTMILEWKKEDNKQSH